MTFDEIQKRGTLEIKLYSREAKIAEIVRREDMVEWAHRPANSLPVNKPLPRLKLTPAAAYVLGRQMIKKSISIMLP